MKLRWPFLVWLLVAALAIAIFASNQRQTPIQGMVDVMREDAAPLEDARLVAVYVRPGQAVRAGDKLAEFDTAVLDAELAVEARNAEREVRRMYADADQRVRDLEDAVRSERVAEASDRAEQLAVESEMKRLEDLLARRLVDEASVIRYRIDAARLRNLAGAHAESIRRLEAEMAAAARTRDAILPRGEGGGAIPAVAELERLYALRRAQYTLVARGEGVVSSVLYQPGSVVPGGTAVVTVVIRGTETISGFVPEWSRADLQPGRPVRLARAADPGRLVHARISAVTAEIQPLPLTYAGMTLDNQIRGRRIVVTPDAQLDLVPGEGVMIFTEEPWWARLWRPAGSIYAATTNAPAGGS
jgi:multidrug resistance efflux pump